MGIKYLDAKRLKLLFIGGGKWVIRHEDELNELNVYPVPDGDTGSNMAMTLKAMIEELDAKVKDSSTMQELIEIVEEAVLMGARGNSGTILSQIITGFLKGIIGKEKLLVEDVAIALEKSKEVAYMAVNEPVEGTMLTVIRMISEKGREIVGTTTDLLKMLDELTKAAKAAVDLTPELLPKLKEAGVVDAGGKGVYYFFEGFYKIATEMNLLEELRKSEVKESDFAKTIANIDHDPGHIEFQYCTEYIIRNGEFDIEEYKKRILSLGDSAVFANTTKKFKTHIHTNTPGTALEIAKEYGDLEKIKIENMKLQNENLQIDSEKDQAKIYVNTRANKTQDAYVIIADTEALKDEFLKRGADVVILGGQSKNPSVQEILTAVSKVNKTNIFVLPNNKNVITTAKLAAEKSNKKNVAVFETRTMLEGHYVLKNKDLDIETLFADEKRNNSIEITKAVRDTKVDELQIVKDNYIGLVNGKIKYTNPSIEILVETMLDDLITSDTVIATIIEGIEKDEASKKAIQDKFFESGIKPAYIVGDQFNYNYYIYIENKDPNMPEIAIVTDSTSDLLPEDIIGLPVKVVPLKIDINGELLRDGVEITRTEFWDKLLNSDTIPKTSQPSPQDFLNTYNALFEKGFKKIISIHASAKTSGTIQAAKVARSLTNRENDIELVDSQALSIMEGMLVVETAKKVVKNESFTDILNWLYQARSKAKFLIVITDLKYLEKGGRMNKASLMAGGLLHLKPIITMSQGEIIVEKKVIGEMGAIKYIEKYIKEESKNQSINIWTGWGGTPKELELVSRFTQEFSGNPKVNFQVVNRLVGGVIGAHTGPTIGIVIFPKLS